MASTYEKIATTTLGSATASVTFSSISGSYTDLVLISSIKSSSNGENLEWQIGNGSVDTGSNYSRTVIDGDGTTARSTRASSTIYCQSGWYVTPSATNFSVSIINFQNYSNTTTYKTMLSRLSSIDGTYTGTCEDVNLWRSTSAINTIKIFLSGSATYATGSTFTLYGIKAA
jgi:hypothetical protein